MSDAVCSVCGRYVHDRYDTRGAAIDHYLDFHQGEPVEAVTFIAVWHIEQETGLNNLAFPTSP